MRENSIEARGWKTLMNLAKKEDDLLAFLDYHQKYYDVTGHW